MSTPGSAVFSDAALDEYLKLDSDHQIATYRALAPETQKALMTAVQARANKVKPSSTVPNKPSSPEWSFWGDPERWASLGHGAASALGDLWETGKGLVKTVATPPTPEELGPAGKHNPFAPLAVISKRLGKGYVEATQANLERAKQAGSQGDTAGVLINSAAAGLPLVGPAIGGIYEQASEGDTSGAIGTGVSRALQLASMAPKGSVIPNPAAAVARGVVRGASRVSIPRSLTDLMPNKYRPTTVPIAGVDVPVMVGEANPLSDAGLANLRLKKAGYAPNLFKEFTARQQAAVKQVIRNVARDTSDLTGPISDEPGAAMHDAASATHAQARPMYAALDASLTTVPDALESVSKVTQEAMAKARRLGVEVGDPRAAEIASATKGMNPDVVRQIYESEGVSMEPGTPLQSYLAIRSQLTKMQRASSDPALRYTIGQEVNRMNANIRAALAPHPELLANLTEADRLWSKGIALRDLSKALYEATEGTPEAAQAKGLPPLPQTVKPSLVAKLNELERDGTLARGLSRSEIDNLRSSIDIIDRASEAGPPTIGSEATLKGYNPHTSVFYWLREKANIPRIRAMTTVRGVTALRRMANAPDPIEFSRAAAMMDSAGLPASDSKRMPEKP